MNIVDSAGLGTHTIAVIDGEPRVRTMLAMQLGENVQAASFPNLDTFEAKVAATAPVVAVLGPSYADVEGLSSIVALRSRRPAVAVVLVAAELSTTVLQQAMRS